MPPAAPDPHPAVYPYLLFRDLSEGGFFAEHVDLEGCASQGETAEEAVANLDEARALWIGTRLEDGLHVPEPTSDEDYVALRMDPDLHRQLAGYAARNDMSVDQLFVEVLTAFAKKARGREDAASPNGSAADAEQPYGGVISLIDEWLADGSGYDEDVGPLLEKELQSNPLKIG